MYKEYVRYIFRQFLFKFFDKIKFKETGIYYRLYYLRYATD